MPRQLTSILLVMLLTTGLTLPAHAQSRDAGRLPVKRVVLYKNGVGYFEHSAHVQGTQELNIDFTTAQLNDVLKSLTVVDLGEGRISSVRYNSIAPLGERLKGLRLPFGEDVGRDDFLTAMRGARVDVRSGAATSTGKLLSVEKVKHQNAKGEDLYETTEFAIVTDSGEMRSFVLSPAVSVHLADHELTSEVGRYLDLVGSSRARDLRQMTITATGTGERNIFVSYISEVPIWKSTYRIILPDEATSKPGTKPLLQGWAIVDNTIGEDWKDVHLSLVAGAPQSFVQNISQPFYARRPEIPLPQSVQLTPQSHEATVDEGAPVAPPPPVSGNGIGSGSGGGVGYGYGAYRVGSGNTLQGIVKDPSGAVIAGARVNIRNTAGFYQSATTDSNGRYLFNNVPAGQAKVEITSPGFKHQIVNSNVASNLSNQVDATLNVATAAETVEVTAEATTLNTESASLSSLAGKQTTEAEGKSAGDFFEYDLKQNITIGQNQSALVPIVQSHVEAEKVTLWNADTVPLMALWIKNTSGQILDSGSFNIIEGNTFAGEGVLEVLHPDERRLLSYAGDSAIHVKTLGDSSSSPYTSVRIVKGNMTLIREERKSTKYTLRNADTKARVVVIEHPSQESEGWKLSASTPKPEETTTSFQRFRVSVDAGKTAELAVEESHSLGATTELSDLDSDQVKLLVDQNRVTPTMKKAFDDVLTQKSKVSSLDLQINQNNNEITKITADQTRLRENMKALKGSAEEKTLLQRYLRELDSQEDRLATLRKGIEDVQARRNQAQGELDRLIESIDLDEHF
jgi:hypothetical protein